MAASLPVAAHASFHIRDFNRYVRQRCRIGSDDRRGQWIAGGPGHDDSRRCLRGNELRRRFAGDEAVEQCHLHPSRARRFRHRNHDSGQERHSVGHADADGAFRRSAAAAHHRCVSGDARVYRPRGDMGYGDRYDAVDDGGRRSRSARGGRSGNDRRPWRSVVRRGRLDRISPHASRARRRRFAHVSGRRLPRLLLDRSPGCNAASDADYRLRTARNHGPEFLARVRHRDGKP